MSMYDAFIYIDGLKAGDFVDTGGVYYGPYNALTCLEITETTIAVHVKGHYQFWSQTRHYIPAECFVFKLVEVEGNRWNCKKIYEQKCGRRSRQVKAEAIAVARANRRSK